MNLSLKKRGIMDILGHFTTITRHKAEVMKNCFRAGLYLQGVTHDLSKYEPAEFLRGVKYYQGNKSPNDAERRETGVSKAWLHHKGRNKHHFEYWIDYDPAIGGKMGGLEMPLNFLLEMVCDRIAASKIYLKDKYKDSSPLEYYNHSKGKGYMNPKTERQLVKLLTILADEGEEELFKYMRKLVEVQKRKNLSKLRRKLLK